MLSLLAHPGLCGVIVGQDWRVSGNLPDPPPGQVIMFVCQCCRCTCCACLQLSPPPLIYLLLFSGAVELGAPLPKAPMHQSY